MQTKCKGVIGLTDHICHFKITSNPLGV